MAAVNELPVGEWLYVIPSAGCYRLEGRKMRNRLMLAGAALLVLAGLIDLPPSPKTLHPGDTQGDAALTQGVIDRIRAGTGYYDAMETALRTQGYALRPFWSFRLPLLARFTAMFPTNTVPHILLIALSVAVWLIWSLRMESRWTFAIGGSLLTFPILVSWAPQSLLFHDVWAGLLIALGLGLYPRCRWAALACGVIALGIREHAAICAGVMLLCAWRDRRQCLAWAAAILGFTVYLLVHVWIVSGHVLPDDPAKNWVTVAGWSFIVSTARWTLLTAFSPTAVCAVVMPIALLGLAHLKDYRPLAVVGAYIAVFLFAGVADDWYWGLLYSPLLAVGIGIELPALWGDIKTVTWRATT